MDEWRTQSQVLGLGRGVCCCCWWWCCRCDRWRHSVYLLLIFISTVRFTESFVWRSLDWSKQELHLGFGNEVFPPPPLPPPLLPPHRPIVNLFFVPHIFLLCQNSVIIIQAKPPTLLYPVSDSSVSQMTCDLVPWVWVSAVRWIFKWLSSTSALWFQLLVSRGQTPHSSALVGVETKGERRAS